MSSNFNEETRNKASAAMGAANAAKSQLIANHKDEYDRLVGDLRVAAGLPREPGPDKSALVRRRIAKYEQKLDELRTKLESQ